MKSRFTIPFLVFANLVALISGCRTVEVSPSVTGIGIYMLNVPLPADAIVEFKLVETNSEGAITGTISEQIVRNARRAPVDFDLPYSKKDIRSKAHYAVTCEIRSQGAVIYRAPRPFPVLTQGNPTRAEVLLEPMR